MSAQSNIVETLRHEILMARGRVYEVGSVSPMEEIHVDDDTTIFLKREDLCPMKAYKWRGAYNKIAQLPDDITGVVAASAGNHAQGVAIAAARLDGKIHAHIFMPRNTPQMKQDAVKRLGGKHITIYLSGDRYDEAVTAAKELAEENNYAIVHAFDDPIVMAGQGTIGDEIVMSGRGPFDAAFLPIGGGGLAAGVATWLKYYYPDIKIYGVEGRDQACMAAAVEAGEPVVLDHVDIFCDGTAVARAGDNTFAACREVIDEYIQVSNEEVCAAMQYLWEERRILPEPAGAMGLAGWLTHREQLPKFRNIVTIVCGANMDFARLQRVVRGARIGSARRRYLRFALSERPGMLMQLLNELHTQANIVEFQYGKTDPDTAYPVIGFDMRDEPFTELAADWERRDVKFEDLTGEPDIEFRAIGYDSSLFRKIYFVQLEFPERAGALADFLSGSKTQANLVYFNYQFSGERFGKALIGFDFETEEERQEFIDYSHSDDSTARTVKPLTPSQLERILRG